MNYLDRFGKIYREEGLFAALRRSLVFGYNEFVWPLLPERETTLTYNGVTVREKYARLFDPTFNSLGFESVGIARRRTEHPLVMAIDEHIGEADDVVIVGGGSGVSAVRAAERVGSDGTITVYEAAHEWVDTVRESAQRNGVESRIEVLHALVGREISLRGSAGDAAHVSPAELPDCDVLVLDCEGSELGILESMEATPRALIVETHGSLDAPKDAVESRLVERGYEVASCRAEWADEGVYILAAVGPSPTTSDRGDVTNPP